MQNSIANRTLGFWIGLLASAIMGGAAIVFIITNSADKTFSWITVILIFIGIILEMLAVLKRFDILPLLVAVCYGTAFSVHMYIGLPTLSDIVNGVNFIGGNATAVIVFGILFSIGMLLSVISSFMKQYQ